jgi:hypothetical protein
MHSRIETSKLIKLKKRQQRFNTKLEVTLLPSPEFVKYFLIVMRGKNYLISTLIKYTVTKIQKSFLNYLTVLFSYYTIPS